ncbi:V/A-type H+-transporting ATPase subunit D [Georgenia soli]|uniref:V/A-type H+-transporting ATPase subunit D n=1 Tax=Georgenia soli TaxID=638953 RepID=A0A2A9EKX0_9MICO|nr:V-type ATP synthase subunit D [Georgenia soli]PFG38890.1 V/A-type H+-transporting ATPase subunit D [Georgenia soli]
MPGALHAPPGRAGRLWLQHRLATARHGAELLDHKLRIVRGERERYMLLRERTADAWAGTAAEAQRWSVRAALLAGEEGLGRASAASPATVEIAWEEPMGVRYPAGARCIVPEPAEDAAPLDTAALAAARAACGRALEAAVAHAAAEAAVRVPEEQERATRRRMRAVRERWIPRLEAALAEAELRLEEDERAEGLRLRWAAGHGPGERPSPGERPGPGEGSGRS